MSERSATPLFPEQQEFLIRIVKIYRSGVRGPFLFSRSNSGSSISYEGATHVAWSPGIDDISLKELSQLNLIIIEQQAPNVYRGKPTAAGIAYVTALAKSPESGAGNAENAMAAAPVAEGLAVSGVAESDDLLETGSVGAGNEMAAVALTEKEVLRRERAALLADYKAATGIRSDRAIYNCAGNAHSCHKPEFLRWKKGDLRSESETCISLETFLKERRKPPLR